MSAHTQIFDEYVQTLCKVYREVGGGFQWDVRGDLEERTGSVEIRLNTTTLLGNAHTFVSCPRGGSMLKT